MRSSFKFKGDMDKGWSEHGLLPNRCIVNLTVFGIGLIFFVSLVGSYSKGSTRQLKCVLCVSPSKEVVGTGVTT